MSAKKWLCCSSLLTLVMLSACAVSTSTESDDLAETPTSQPQPEPTPQSEPDQIVDGLPCESLTLGITLTMPSPTWNCETLNERWLKLTSSLFEVNISDLGRGPFCFPDMDSSCETTPFFANEVVNLQLYNSGGQPREIFGLAQFPDSETSVWVAITWQDMAAHALTEAESSEIVKLVSTLSLLNR